MLALIKIAVLATFVAMAASKGCSPGPVDVMFVITTNDTFTQAEFRNKIGIVEEFASGTTIGPDDVRVGLITEYEYPDLEFHMDDHMEQQELELAITYTYFNGGKSSKFGAGLQYVNQFGIDSQLGGRPGVPDVVVFLTTGIPADYTFAEKEAKKLTDSGATVISVAMRDVENADLVKIASGCHYVIEGAQSSSLAVIEVVQKALNLTCDAIQGVPFDACKCPMIEADIMFLLDASLAQGKDNFQKQKQFAANVVEELNIMPNETRVGAVTYSVHAHPQFDLDYHPDKFELKLGLKFIPFQGEPGRHMADGLSYINENGFTSAQWNRKPAQKIVILTVTGSLDNLNSANSAILKQAQMLRDQGAKIISVGVPPASQQDLEAISPQAGQHMMYKNYDDMLTGAKKLAQRVCQDDSVVPTAAPMTTTTKATTQSSVCQSATQCQNGGTCRVLLGVETCDCPAGFGGTVCDVVLTAPPTPSTAKPTAAPTKPAVGPCQQFNPCFNGGTCVPVGDTATCSCAPGYTGPACYNPITSAPATTVSPNTPAQTTVSSGDKPLRDQLGKAGCQPADIVFLVERWYGDSQGDVDHEADFIARLVRAWQIDASHVRIGVVEYGSVITEHIHLNDYNGKKPDLLTKLNDLQNTVSTGGSANVAAAMDDARQNMFKPPRSNADKIVVAIVHDMSPLSRRDIAGAAQRLKDDGVTVYGIGVAMKNEEKSYVRDNSDYFYEFSRFSYLEGHIPSRNYHPCS